MKKILALLCMNLVLAWAAAESINVKDFGASGDGRTDDTAAIQAAFDAAAKKQQGGKSAIYYHAAPEVVFPTGIYAISDALKIKIQIVRGLGQPFIKQTDKSKDIFYFDFMWQGKVTNLNFIGGKNHISMGNGNLDCGHITIEGCKFYDADGVCLETRKGSNSTFFVIKNCNFIYNRQAVISNCDKTTIVDCWMSTLPAMENMAAIVNVHGVMTVERLLGVPLVARRGQRWIDNEKGSVYCRDCRFGGEGGGFTPVYNWAKYNPDAGSGPVISLSNCEVNAQGNYKAMAAVYCVEVPNLISVENCLLRGVPGIKIDKNLDLKNYFDKAHPGALSYSIKNCTGAYTDLPKALQRPSMLGKPDIPGQISRRDGKKLLQQRLASLPTAPADLPPIPEDCYVPPKKSWTLDAYMDATPIKNAERLMLDFQQDRAVLMWRAESSGWPHVEIPNIKVDLDRYPILEIIVNNPENTPLETAVKLVDEDEEELFQLSGQGSRTNLRYDLREYGLSGKKTLSLRFYYLGIRYVPPKNNQTYTYDKTKPGDYIIIERLLFRKADSEK